MGQGLQADTFQGLLDASYGEDTIPPGWKKDKELSTNQNKVFVGPNYQTVVAHRGTTGTMQDWANNVAYGVGGLQAYKLSDRYRKAERVQREAEQKYGDVITIGHSQGGLLAQELGRGEVITLNKATRPGDALQRKPSRQTDVRSNLDVVSVMGNKRGNITIPALSRNPIEEHGTQILERMDNAFIGLQGSGSAATRATAPPPDNVPPPNPPQIGLEDFENFLQTLTPEELGDLQQEINDVLTGNI